VSRQFDGWGLNTMNAEQRWKHLTGIAREEVKETLASLPKALRQPAEQLPVTFERRPTPAMIDDGIESDTLGLFLGGAFPDHEAGPDPLPPQILLFLDNLWDFAEGDEEAFRFEIRATLMHELGHYLGLDESDLEARGLD
jgi:predicted Zn-dependent protease with MMP-like domain